MCVCVHICVHVCVWREREVGKCEDMGRKKTSYKEGLRMFKNVREEGVCPREGSTRSESSGVHEPGLERDVGEGQSRQESAGG